MVVARAAGRAVLPGDRGRRRHAGGVVVVMLVVVRGGSGGGAVRGRGARWQ